MLKSNYLNGHEILDLVYVFHNILLSIVLKVLSGLFLLFYGYIFQIMVNIRLVRCVLNRPISSCSFVTSATRQSGKLNSFFIWRRFLDFNIFAHGSSCTLTKQNVFNWDLYRKLYQIWKMENGVRLFHLITTEEC